MEFRTLRRSERELLLDLLDCWEVPDGWAAYNAKAPPVPLPDYLAALATAFAAGLLEHSGGV